jgi:hypothetical protein
VQASSLALQESARAFPRKERSDVFRRVGGVLVLQDRRKDRFTQEHRGRGDRTVKMQSDVGAGETQEADGEE